MGVIGQAAMWWWSCGGYHSILAVVVAEAEGGAGPTADELADAVSETAASTILTGFSLYTENTHALTGV